MNWDHKGITNMLHFLLCLITLPSKAPSIPFLYGWGRFIMTDCTMRRQGCSCVNTPLTVVAIQTLLKTAHKQQWKAKDAYRGSKCGRSKKRVLLEEAAVYSGEFQALCWFITLLGLVTGIRTSMFQSDSWPLRFTHPTANTATVDAVFKHTHTHKNTLGQTRVSYTCTQKFEKNALMKRTTQTLA